MNILNFILLLLIISFLFIAGCATHSRAILVYKGEVDLVLDENCTMVGRIIDRETKKPLVGANIILENTSIGGSSGNNGNYSIGRIPPGNYNIIVSRFGFEKLVLNNFNFEKSHYYLMDFELVYDPPVFQYESNGISL